MVVVVAVVKILSSFLFVRQPEGSPQSQVCVLVFGGVRKRALRAQLSASPIIIGNWRVWSPRWGYSPDKRVSSGVALYPASQLPLIISSKWTAPGRAGKLNTVIPSIYTIGEKSWEPLSQIRNVKLQSARKFVSRCGTSSAQPGERLQSRERLGLCRSAHVYVTTTLVHPEC